MSLFKAVGILRFVEYDFRGGKALRKYYLRNPETDEEKIMIVDGQKQALRDRR
jgi:hypothetical protein